MPSAVSSSQAGACAAVDEALADRLFQRWADLVKTGDAEAVADLYGPEALLLPTLSARTRQSHADIADYFAGFAAAHPDAEVIERTVFPGCNEVVDAGIYRFHFGANPPGPKQAGEGHSGSDAVVEARYTFVYGFNGEQWKLLHHHSSLLPDSAPLALVDP